MKLNKEHLDYIFGVTSTAQMLGIDDAIIEPGAVRAMDDKKTIIMMQKEGVPDLPIHSIGLNRLAMLHSRFNTLNQMDDFSVSFETGGGDWVRSIKLSSKQTRVTYLCANPISITAPRDIGDEYTTSFHTNENTHTILSQGASLMKAEVCTIISDGVSVKFEFIDTNNDVFSHVLETEVSSLRDDGATSFVFSYPSKELLMILRHNEDSTIKIGQRGVLHSSINKLGIFLLPRV